MNHQPNNKKPKPTPEAYVNRYIRFDPPSRLPSLMCPWSYNVERATQAAMKLGCAVYDVKTPVPGTEIIGSNARMMIRDRENSPVKGIAIEDQFITMDFETKVEAYRFMNCIIEKIEHIGHEVEYITSTDRNKHFVVRTTDGYTLYCVSNVTDNTDSLLDHVGLTKEALLFVHWRIDYHAPRKRQPNNKATDSNLPHGTKAA